MFELFIRWLQIRYKVNSGDNHNADAYAKGDMMPLTDDQMKRYIYI